MQALACDVFFGFFLAVTWLRCSIPMTLPYVHLRGLHAKLGAPLRDAHSRASTACSWIRT